MILQQNSVNLKATGTTCSVSSDPYAKLMYYIDCICHLIPLESICPEIKPFRNYGNYYNLSAQDKAKVVALAITLKPDLLAGKLLFVAPQLCPDASN